MGNKIDQVHELRTREFAALREKRARRLTRDCFCDLGAPRTDDSYSDGATARRTPVDLRDGGLRSGVDEALE
jgi:molybdopterin biosynthesis enzyme